MEANSDSQIPRAPSKFDHDSFMALLKLNQENPWLEHESRGMIELWNFCNNGDEQSLIAELIRRFEFVDAIKLSQYSSYVANVITNDWGAKSSTTRIVAVSDEFAADGSQLFLQVLKNKFSVHDGWDEKCFINDIRSGVEATKNGWTIVLLDDFIGTGKTIRRKTKWFLEKVQEQKKRDVTVKAVAIAGMESAKDCLVELGVDCYCPVWLKKGIADEYAGDALIESTRLMKALEGRLGSKFKGLFLPNFGYGRSEALFCVNYANVPNNVFPIFWWPILKDSTPRTTMFHRIR